MPAPPAQLSLLVIFAGDFEKSAAFYQAIGAGFERHSHPPCGEHYASLGGGCLFEIYPRKEGQSVAAMTFGFDVASVEDAVRNVMANGGTIKRPAHQTAWGISATVIDPDGNSVLLTERQAEPTATAENVD